jgi:chemotaxis response regulator CheB
MNCPTSRCRILIVSRHGLFAEGIRSLLRMRRGFQIVGLERDPEKALDAVDSLRPEVIIFDQSEDRIDPFILGTILLREATEQVVALDLRTNYTMIFGRRRLGAARPKDLVKAIQRVGEPFIPRPDQSHSRASMPFKCESARDGVEGRSGRKSRARRTREEGTEVPGRPPRASRGSKKGGERDACGAA